MTAEPPANPPAPAAAPPAASARVAVVANPYSGAKSNTQRVQDLVTELRKRSLTPQVITDPLPRADPGDRSPAAPPPFGCVIAVGGDGTVADALNHWPNVPLATLPAGNENLFARQYGFAADAARLAAAVAAGRTRRIDVGRVTPLDTSPSAGRLFTLMLSAGFDAAVVHRLDAWRRATRPSSTPSSDEAGLPKSGDTLRRVRRRTYLRPILTALRRYPYDPITLDADGTQVRGTHVLLFNLPQYGMTLHFAPDARDDDGQLDWLVFPRPGLFALLRYVLAVKTHRHLHNPATPRGRAARFTLRSDRPVPVQADGDVIGHTPIDVTVLPAAVRVIDIRSDPAVP